MPRRVFMEDLATSANNPTPPLGISNLELGSEDGTFTFQYAMPTFPEFTIEVFINVDDYPTTHNYFFCALNDDVPLGLEEAINDVGSEVPGFRLSSALAAVSTKFHRVLFPGRDPDSDMELYEASEEGEDLEDNEDSDVAMDDASEEQSETANDPENMSVQKNKAVCTRLRLDLRALVDAGYHIGVIGGLRHNESNGIIAVSCRIKRLGLSEEILKAWSLNRDEFLVLLIRYNQGYMPFEDLETAIVISIRYKMDFRVGLCYEYKPSVVEALAAFKPKLTHVSSSDESRRGQIEKGKFRSAFISKSLNNLLKDHLLSILSYRVDCHCSWHVAEEAIYTLMTKQSSTVAAKFSEETSSDPDLPKIVTDDHLCSSSSSSSSVNFRSLPLLAMQFVIRHLVNCTKYCLVCHKRIKDNFEALKPYVCDDPLCLYQYVNYGFGPSIEHEILEQPLVVDLLISLCYSSASVMTLHDLPRGLDLVVPVCRDLYPSAANLGLMTPDLLVPGLSEPKNVHTPIEQQWYAVDYYYETSQVCFSKKSLEMDGTCPVKVGDWVVLEASQKARALHCRVSDIGGFPRINLNRPIDGPTPPLKGIRKGANDDPWRIAQIATMVPVKLTPYKLRFDDLSLEDRFLSLRLMLDLLPSVDEMRRHILYQGGSLELHRWTDRAPPAAFNILRWILATNRACIMQVDMLDGQQAATSKYEERIFGMGPPQQFLQFRLATGAPSKERRFLKEVGIAFKQTKLDAPTIFAWHGSALQNWHNILREGLNFKKIVNGRSYGNGVYHSLNYTTSIGYSTQGHSSMDRWKNSSINVQGAIALNEIVNNPSRYVALSPHIVVDRLEWIQTRYLFVQTGAVFKEKPQEQFGVTLELEQDKHFKPVGCNQDHIVIPMTAINGSRRPRGPPPTDTTNKGKNKVSDEAADTYSDSDTDNFSDLEFLLDESDNPALRLVNVNKGYTANGFVPGMLEASTLPMLQPPVYATPRASTQIQRRLREALEVQRTTNLFELGWFLNPDMFLNPDIMENMYQWIVEFHSFDPNTLLAKQMKTKGIKSVVIEIRFGPDFPNSPPFVRVIRPRFLPLYQGGGGHITTGGAICMELLTNTGWSPICSMESLFLQIRMQITENDPPAQLLNGKFSDYGIGEAMEAYKRFCHNHGWRIPRDLKEIERAGAGFASAPYAV